MAKRAYEAERIRTFALVGHRSSGKTSLGDLLLHTAGVTRAVGRVSERTSLLDHESQERQRGMSLGLSFAWMEWGDHLLQLVDTPGSKGLAHEREVALAGVDAAIVVVSATDGVEFGTEGALADAARLGVPRVVVVSKMDRKRKVDTIKAHLERSTGLRCVPMQLPFYDDDGQFAGVVSLLQRKVLRYDSEGNGTYSLEPMPDRVVGAVDAAWEHVMESVALTDDRLLEHYLEYLSLPNDLVQRGMARAMAKGLILPLLYTSSLLCIGAHAILDLAPWAMPAPGATASTVQKQDGESLVLSLDGPFVARLISSRFDLDDQPYHVFRILSGKPPKNGELYNSRTAKSCKIRRVYQIRGPRRTSAVNIGPGAILGTWDHMCGRPGDVFTAGEPLFLPPLTPAPQMVSWLVNAKRTRDADVIHTALTQLGEMDRGLLVEREPLTQGLVISGATRAHLELVINGLQDRLDMRVETQTPPIAYREVPNGAVEGIAGIHRKASGDDVLEFGECWIDLKPMGTAQELVRTGKAEGIPSRFIEALNTGFLSGLRHGPTAGYPVAGVNIECTSGEYDVFISTDEHFQAAGELAARAAMVAAGSVLFEPWSVLSIVTPSEEVGQILNDIAAHRGRILGMDVRGRIATIRAHCPDRELSKFAPRLASCTGGRGHFSRTHSHYGVLDPQFVRDAIERSPFRHGAKTTVTPRTNASRRAKG